jgi:pimeloyl-ACP methyl ester carboxylesterase
LGHYTLASRDSGLAKILSFCENNMSILRNLVRRIGREEGQMHLYHTLLASWILMITPMLGQTTLTAVKGATAPIRGLNLYYEVHSPQAGGSGVPLILLHGGLQSTDSYSGIIPALSANREVIAVDLQAHGRTADIDRPISIEAMGDDIAGLADYLHLEKVDVMGYSLGGATALRMAIQHPGLIRKLILVSTPCKRDGWFPEIQAAMSQPFPAEQMKQSPLYQTYAKVAPRPQDWEVLLNKMHQLLGKDYDWSAAVPGIKAQTMLIYGDADAIRPSHEVEFFGLLGGGKKDAGWDGSGMPTSRLAILPGATHYNMIASPLLPTVVVDFLNAPVPPGK